MHGMIRRPRLRLQKVKKLTDGNKSHKGENERCSKAGHTVEQKSNVELDVQLSN
jgi:hypothetical protein